MKKLILIILTVLMLSGCTPRAGSPVCVEYEAREELVKVDVILDDDKEYIRSDAFCIKYEPYNPPTNE